MTILDRIVEHKREELGGLMDKTPLESVRVLADAAPPPLDLIAALRSKPGVALIAEVKRGSPSKGLLRQDLDPVSLAQAYARHGAAAISVLTDEHFFQGSLADLIRIRGALEGAIPLLRKDFILHPYQVFQARAAGADGLLLIAAVLSDEDLAGLLSLTRGLGMTALVEVRDQSELERVLPLSARLVGVNNRNLHDFSMNLESCLVLRPHAPDSVCFVAESGIHSAADARRLAAARVNAMLVGEALVTAPDVGAKVRELIDGGQNQDLWIDPGLGRQGGD